MRTWKQRTYRRHQRDARFYYLGIKNSWKDLTRLPFAKRVGLAILLVFRGSRKEPRKW